MNSAIQFPTHRGVRAFAGWLLVFLAFTLVGDLGALTTTRHDDGSPVPGQQFEFSYDDIGNRRETRTGGNGGSSNLRVSTYTPNLLNQVTQRTVPGFAELQGLANAAATVTVNVQPVERQGPFWRYEQGVNNSTGAVRQAMSIVAVLNGAGPDGKDIVSQGTGNVFVAKSPETMTYDLAGRLVEDGQWNYQWDADSRLIRIMSLTNAPESAQRRIFFSYDHLGRRTQKLTYHMVSGNWVWSETRQCLSDGWNLLAELDHNGNVVRTYSWGPDLSGTLHGAGGVGGLVFVKQTNGAAAFPALDGNGNVTALYSATDGSELARYDHGPFGETLRASGPWAFANPFRFSTKYQDDETGLYNFGERLYRPELGRWLSKDPIGEEGGLNLYGFNFSDPVNFVDTDGRQPFNIAVPPRVSPRSGPVYGQITDEIFSELRANRQAFKTPADRVAERMWREQWERELSQQFPGHKWGQTYLLPGPPPSRPPQPSCVCIENSQSNRNAPPQFVIQSGSSLLPGTSCIRAARTGSGPAGGFLEVSDAYGSSRAVQNFGSPRPTDFIFDLQSQRFIMGRGPHGHDSVLQAARIAPSDRIVGGRIWRENGRLITDESSGHYGQGGNWLRRGVREEFQDFMNQHGVDITHRPWPYR